MGKAPVLSDAAGRLRLVVLASRPWGTTPSQRFRFEQWAPFLASEHGIDLELIPFESHALSKILHAPGHRIRKSALVARDLLRRAAVLKKVRKADVVLVHREAALVGPPLIERAIAASGPPMILDFDDAIWRSQIARSPLFEWLRGYRKFDELCRLSAAISAGNAYLAARAMPSNPRTHIVPTSIDTDLYRLLPERADTRFTVGWTGSLSTLAHFELARGMLEQLARRIPLTVKVMCNRPPDRPIDGAKNEFVPWSPEHEVREVADCHVGIMPLPDDEFSRGKCGLKALQFMATGRPVVLSPYGVNADIVEDGRTGFFARSKDEWVARLEVLAADPDKRAKMGRAARKRVEDHYSMRACAALFATIVDEVVDRSSAGPRRDI